jgi:nicotinamide mononucleotide transporter
VLAWLALNWTQVFGFLTGAACVWLAARRNILNYPIGIASNVVFFVVFIGSALYADAGLQVVYTVLGITGWIAWTRSKAADARTATRRLDWRIAVGLALVGLAGTVVLTLVLTRFTDSTTQIADASTTMASLVAQFMMNRRWIESWFVWAAVDVAYVGLYLYKGLWITAILYALFIVLAATGYRIWRRAPHEIALLEPVHA